LYASDIPSNTPSESTEINDSKMKKITQKYPVLVNLLYKLKKHQVKNFASFNHLLDYHCPKPLVADPQQAEKELSQPTLGLDDDELGSQSTAVMFSEDNQFVPPPSEIDYLITQPVSQEFNIEDEEPNEPLSVQFNSLIKHDCSHKQASSFVRAVCKRLIPFELLGSMHNFHTVQNNIDRFVRLGRFEQFSLHPRTKIIRSLFYNKHLFRHLECLVFQMATKDTNEQ
jgi:hypothetical protein